VAVDAQGSVYVADLVGDRVVKFSSSGNQLGTFGSPLHVAGELSWPVGIGLDGAGNVYVADTGNRRVQKLASDGTPLAQWSTGDDEPVSPGVDSAGTVYVTEDVPGGSAGYGVATYTPDGRLLPVWR